MSDADFTDEQLANARTLYAVVTAAGASDRALLASFEAGLVESEMLANPQPCGGDHSSAGLMQQQEGWVPEDEKPAEEGWCVEGEDPRLDPTWASGAFVHGTVGHRGVLYFDKRGTDPLGEPIKSAGNLAQAVQRSAYPDRYDEREDDARALLAEVDSPSEVGGPVPARTADQTFVHEGQQHYFGRGADGTLEHVWWDPKDKSVLHRNDWGGQLEGQPIAYVDGKQQHVFGRDRDGRLQHWYWTPTKDKITREAWTRPGQVTADPAGFVTSTSEHVFYRGPKGSLMHTYYSRPKKKRITANWGGMWAAP